MAIYHFSVQIIGRSSGKSVVAAAAYRAGDVLLDKRTGITHNYTRKQGVYETRILLPENAPLWMQDRSQLWNEVERCERQCNSQLAREINVAIPKELNHEQKRSLVYEYVESEFVSRGMIADVALHDLNSENPHAHLLLTQRSVTANGFGNKNREWNQKSVLQSHRSSWAIHANRALENAGHESRIDYRSLKDQGLDRLPQIHLGPQVKEMDLKGRSTDRGDEYRRIEAANHEQAELLQELRRIEAELLLLDETEAAELQDSASAIDEILDSLLPLSILEQYKIQMARVQEEERSAQETLDALEQRGQRSLFNPFGATAVDLQVATAVVRSVQADRVALEIAVQRLEQIEADRSPESEGWERRFEILRSQESLNLPVNELSSNLGINSPAAIPDRRAEVQAFLSELQLRLDRAARQILDDIGTTAGSRRRMAQVGSYRILEQDDGLWIQVVGASDGSLRSILQKGELVRGIKRSDLENLEENARRVSEVLQGHVYRQERDWER
jgi:ATP-dependent exoDNAse (exonuclease V) alpha subunit